MLNGDFFLRQGYDSERDPQRKGSKQSVRSAREKRLVHSSYPSKYYQERNGKNQGGDRKYMD